jgi:hypothetical protein
MMIMTEFHIPEVVSVIPTGDDLLLLSQSGHTRSTKVTDIRNIAATVEEGGKDKTASNENLKEVKSEMANKASLYVSETLPNIIDRKENTLYFKITDTINSNADSNVTVSPTMGLKLV